jgi:hypothetical protein
MDEKTLSFGPITAGAKIAGYDAETGWYSVTVAVSDGRTSWSTPWASPHGADPEAMLTDAIFSALNDLCMARYDEISTRALYRDLVEPEALERMIGAARRFGSALDAACEWVDLETDWIFSEDGGGPGGHALGQVREKVRVPIAEAERIADRVAGEIRPLARSAILVGSIRRRRFEVADVEYVVLPKDLNEFHAAVRRLGYAVGPKRRIYRHVIGGLPVELYVAHSPKEMGGLVLMYTGDFVWNIAMRSKAKRMGYKLDQYGISKAGRFVLQSPDEREFFDFLGMEWHWPEQRSLAARSDLQKMIRNLRARDLPKYEAVFVETAATVLAEEKWLPPEEEVELRRLHGSRAGAAKMGGVDGLPIEWLPEEWRDPDVGDEEHQVWRGEGDYVAEVVFLPAGFRVCEYTAAGAVVPRDPAFMAPFARFCVFVGFAELAGALVEMGWELSAAEVDADRHHLARYAASYGSAKIQQWGGEMEPADALP